MQNLKLGEYLRYACAGAVGYATIFLSYPQVRKMLPFSNTSLAIVGAIVLLLGIFIYSAHRALIYPFIHYILLAILHPTETFRRFPWKPSVGEYARDIARWKRLDEAKSPQRHLTDWFARIHFLYCSTWAIWLALLLGRIFAPPASA